MIRLAVISEGKDLDGDQNKYQENPVVYISKAFMLMGFVLMVGLRLAIPLLNMIAPFLVARRRMRR
jgi:uncharacterized protein involved in cysteine biosynthesis